MTFNLKPTLGLKLKFREKAGVSSSMEIRKYYVFLKRFKMRLIPNIYSLFY